MAYQSIEDITIHNDQEAPEEFERRTYTNEELVEMLNNNPNTLNCYVSINNIVQAQNLFYLYDDTIRIREEHPEAYKNGTNITRDNIFFRDGCSKPLEIENPIIREAMNEQIPPLDNSNEANRVVYFIDTSSSMRPIIDRLLVEIKTILTDIHDLHTSSDNPPLVYYSLVVFNRRPKIIFEDLTADKFGPDFVESIWFDVHTWTSLSRTLVEYILANANRTNVNCVILSDGEDTAPRFSSVNTFTMINAYQKMLLREAYKLKNEANWTFTAITNSDSSFSFLKKFCDVKFLPGEKLSTEFKKKTRNVYSGYYFAI